MSDTGTAHSRPVWRAALDRVWVLLVAGGLTGLVVVGIGGRLAMLLLRLTSEQNVRGVLSDDGFVIGRVTLSGTYNLCAVGAGLGVVAAAVYTWVAPWLMGPTWFRRVTCALGAGAVIGGILVNGDGVDFTRLEPTWLAIALFVAIPAAFGGLVGIAVDRARLVAARPGNGRSRAVVAALVGLSMVPFLVILVPISVVVLAWTTLRGNAPLDEMTDMAPLVLFIRAAWLLAALAGARELVLDVQALT